MRVEASGDLSENRCFFLGGFLCVFLVVLNGFLQSKHVSKVLCGFPLQYFRVWPAVWCKAPEIAGLESRRLLLCTKRVGKNCVTLCKNIKLWRVS